PQERVLPLGVVLEGRADPAVNGDSPVYRGPLLPMAATASVGNVVGMAKAARDAFLNRLPDRKITYTGYASQREAPITHLQVGEAAVKIDEAEFHARRVADLVDAKCEAGAEWTLEERARARADVGAVVELSRKAVEIFASASGGTSIYSDIPIQRINRDVQAVSMHALLHPNTNRELYGRVLCGLDPNTLYI
ncbi:acyl-CoA dehydrogenase, partial [Saccharothrix sp. MB29]|nr:acyl-CoA dehydrogenase [Saccharothrix sp. MB29]